MKTKDGETITLRDFFADVLVSTTGNASTTLIKRTERRPDNKLYLKHLREHSGIVKISINQLSTRLDLRLPPEELAKSKGPDRTPVRNLTTFSTSATQKSPEISKNLAWRLPTSIKQTTNTEQKETNHSVVPTRLFQTPNRKIKLIG